MPQFNINFEEKELQNKTITIYFTDINAQIVTSVFQDIGKVGECLEFLKTVLNLIGSFTIDITRSDLSFQGEWCLDNKTINILYLI